MRGWTPYHCPAGIAKSPADSKRCDGKSQLIGGTSIIVLDEMLRKWRESRDSSENQPAKPFGVEERDT